ncbi:TPA: patatin-like phospholipase family protein [Vibrio vulnificus]|nr:patatin-like phospholipase family protein [Vibrio vulnificus]HDY8209488.1 patatin-like phospholipase family protein [Vibrio vulnificus]
MKAGLVLSGGGAMGAYQVGVIKALAEQGIQLQAVSGASIGALNGAIIASESTTQAAYQKLESLWRLLGESNPLKLNKAVYLELLIASGLQLNASKLLKLFSLPQVRTICKQYLPNFMPMQLADSILDDAPLKNLMSEYLDTEALKSGLPLYVSVFESEGAVQDIIQCMMADLGIAENKASEFVHIQSLSSEEQKEALLASAALPLLFNAKTIGGKEYVDGGVGGWSKNQGNTPIKPLIDAGCELVIVSHLSDGSLWSRHDFSQATIIELRPKERIGRNDGLIAGAKDLLGFKPEFIRPWIEQGYNDTMLSLERVQKPLEARSQLAQSESDLQSNLTTSESIDEKLNDLMSRL